jgi:Uma2 family endonuclease
MSDMALEIPIRPITVDEYHRMVRARIIRDDERIELLGGMLVEMPPLGQSHIAAHTRIVQYLIERFGYRLLVSGQASIPLTPTDEPEPDISLFLPETFDKPKSQWTASDVVALIEISDSSLRRDLGPKLRAYSRGGIAEYLVVDLSRPRLIRHLDPDGNSYRRIDELSCGEDFTLLRCPDVSLEVSAFLPPAAQRAAAD